MTEAPRILALDLSLTRSGVCFNSGKTKVVVTGALRGMERVDAIVREVQALVAGDAADLVVIEGYSFGSQGRAVFNIGELGGGVRLLLYRLGVPWVDVPPSCLKKWSTGKGNCDKDAMILAAERGFDFAGQTNDEADAYLLWAMARHAYGDPVGRPTKEQHAALTKVAWPAVGERRAEG